MNANIIRSVRPRILASLLVSAIAIIALAGCLDVPLGNAETSKVDEQYKGFWMCPGKSGDEESTLLAVIPFDARTYVVTMLQYRQTQTGLRLTNGYSKKMWLTRVGDATFATLEDKSPQGLLAPDEHPFAVVRLTRKGDAITTQGVDPKFVKDAKTPEALAKLIAANVDNEKLYCTNEVYEKMGPTRQQEVQDVFNAFGGGNGQ